MLTLVDAMHGWAAVKVLLDPNSFSEDGTIALSGKAFSTDGGIMSYSVSSSGSDWVTIKFMELAGKTSLRDELLRVKFSCQAWYAAYTTSSITAYSRTTKSRRRCASSARLSQRQSLVAFPTRPRRR